MPGNNSEGFKKEKKRNPPTYPRTRKTKEEFMKMFEWN